MNTRFPANPAHFSLPTLPGPLPQHGWSQPSPGSANFRRLLDPFEPIGLAQMDAVALLNRTDTKYVMQTGQLYAALAALSTDYRVLEIDGVRLHPYRTLYFDTADTVATSLDLHRDTPTVNTRERLTFACQALFMSSQLRCSNGALLCLHRGVMASV